LSEEIVSDGAFGVSKTGAGVLAGLRFSEPTFLENVPVASISGRVFVDEAGAAVGLAGTVAAAGGIGSGTEKESPGNNAAEFWLSKTRSLELAGTEAGDASAADGAASGVVREALTEFAGVSLLDASAKS
jgi:hypothetical protein